MGAAAAGRPPRDGPRSVAGAGRRGGSGLLNATATGAGAIALTFDDGPDPVWTPAVLAALGRTGAQATFFLDAARARAWPGCVEEICDGGHEAALHCLRHRRHSELADAEVVADAAGGLAALAALGVSPRAWRAPWGVETGATRTAAAAYDLRLWGWNRDSHDWRGDSQAQMEAGIEAEGGLREGAVVLMHDGIGPGALRTDCAETVALAEALCERAAAAGLETATVSELAVAA